VVLRSMKPKLSPAEAAYIRRFCYEVATRQFGPGSIFDYCRYQSQDLEILATETDIQYDVLEEVAEGREPPSAVPFPWDSFEHLHQRVQEVQLIHS
jgi:hypothetical protein